MRKIGAAALAMYAAILVSGCSKPEAAPVVQPSSVVTTPPLDAPAPAPATTPAPAPATIPAAPATNPSTPAATPKPSGKPVPDPTAITVLVNKVFYLPSTYRPADLVVPNVPFIFKEADDKRLMRKEAAGALERLFAAAKQDGIHLAGVSGYRSYATQESLFAYYVRTQGEETARKYSAEAGHSEHQTGLTMDVSGSTGACAADDCFADTPEARWLAAHAHEHGFIIRYPKGKESITGYNYEPWHIRYVGAALSKEVAAKGLTLEEYFAQAR